MPVSSPPFSRFLRLRAIFVRSRGVACNSRRGGRFVKAGAALLFQWAEIRLMGAAHDLSDQDHFMVVAGPGARLGERIDSACGAMVFPGPSVLHLR